MQTQHAGNMLKLRLEKGILGYNYSFTLNIWPVTTGSAMMYDRVQICEEKAPKSNSQDTDGMWLVNWCKAITKGSCRTMTATWKETWTQPCKVVLHKPSLTY